MLAQGKHASLRLLVAAFCRLMGETLAIGSARPFASCFPDVKNLEASGHMVAVEELRCGGVCIT